MERTIAVLGAGYGGLTAARLLGGALRRTSGYRVVLVNQRDYHELKPKLPEAVGAWTDCAVQVPIAPVLGGSGVTFQQATVTGLDPAARQVLTEAGPLPYWRLVWALGGQPDFAPDGRTIPGLEATAIAPYSEGQACRLRHHVGTQVREAAGLATAEQRQSRLTVVVAGGGFVGVELAGELADRLVDLATQAGLDRREPRLVLVEPRERLLDFDPRLGGAALRALRAKGIDVRFGVRVDAAAPERVYLSDGTTIETQTLVWAGGLRGHPLAAQAGLPTDASGRIVVDANLRVPEWPEVYALGDGASVGALRGRPGLVNSAQAATGQGRAVARAILAEIGGTAVRPYRPEGRGTVVLLGRRQAVAHVGRWAPLETLAPLLKQVPQVEHLWRLGGPRLAAQHLGSTLLPLIAPSRVDRYSRAGDAPTPETPAG